MPGLNMGLLASHEVACPLLYKNMIATQVVSVTFHFLSYWQITIHVLNFSQHVDGSRDIISVV
jgi:hypothetical protein